MLAWLRRGAYAAQLAGDRADLWPAGTLAWLAYLGWAPLLVVVSEPDPRELQSIGVRLVTSSAFPANVIAAAGVLVGVVVLLAILAAAAEVALQRAAAAPSASRPRAAGVTMAGLASLLVALLPTAAAAAAVGIGVAIAAPGAFTSPDLETPILLRLASDVWPLLLVLAAAMVLSQALGAVAFRRATAHLPQPLAAAITGSVADLLRRPASRLGTAAAGMLVDGVLLILTWAVLRVLWAPIAADLGVGRLGGPDTLLLLLGFVAVWLVLLLAAGAWHVAMSAWWALELARDGSEARQAPHRIEDAGTTLDQPTP